MTLYDKQREMLEMLVCLFLFSGGLKIYWRYNVCETLHKRVPFSVGIFVRKLRHILERMLARIWNAWTWIRWRLVGDCAWWQLWKIFTALESFESSLSSLLIKKCSNFLNRINKALIKRKTLLLIRCLLSIKSFSLFNNVSSLERDAHHKCLSWQTPQTFPSLKLFNSIVYQQKCGSPLSQVCVNQISWLK